jgi:hypothetical protein
LKARCAALRVEVQNVQNLSITDPKKDYREDGGETTESESDDEGDMDKLDLFRQVQAIIAENEGMFDDFSSKLNNVNILTATTPQLNQLEASLEKVNDILDLCDDFFTHRDHRDILLGWMRFCVSVKGRVKRMVERVENFTNDISETVRDMGDVTALGATLNSALNLMKSRCSLCLDAKFSVVACSDCLDANVCGDCYSTHILKAREGGLPSMQMSLSFSCIMMRSSACLGAYPEELVCKMLTLKATHALRDYNTEVEYAKKHQEESLAKKMEIRRQAVMTPMDRMYHDEFKRLSQKISNSCRTCLTPFADFVGCAAVTCGTCAQKFCALCLDPCPPEIAEHEHIRSCRLGHYFRNVDGVFVALQNWKHGRARILNEELIEYVRELPFDGELSDGKCFKAKLVETFANHDAPVPPLVPARPQLNRWFNR